MSPMVSVILPCQNAGKYLEPTLRSLVAQDLAGPWEVILIDNGSTDDSVLVAKRFAHQLPLTIVHADERFSTAYARNVGVKASSGDQLIFMDADDTVNPSYLSAMSAALEDHPFVTSRLDLVSLNPEEWVRLAHGPAWQADDGAIVFFGFLPGAGPNIGIHRSLFEAVGGAAEDRLFACDVTLAWEVQLLGGARIHFVPEAVYHYRHRDTLRNLFRQALGWGTSNPILYKNFRAFGMPRRPWRAAIQEWRHVAGQLTRARTRTELAQLVVRAGLLLGHVRGSLRSRILFL
jgi:glycosyltransferase involved in cell wall biosynthesis